MRTIFYNKTKVVHTPDSYLLVLNFHQLPERDKKAIANYEKKIGNE